MSFNENGFELINFIVTLFSAWLPVKNKFNKNLSFASHLAYYPPCFIEPENLEFSKSPIHILIGELDNWTPAPPCEMLVEKLKVNTNINITVYDNSHHSFDKNSPVIRNEEAYNFSDCIFKTIQFKSGNSHFSIHF